ncbi:MAG: BamA/TamA family outer membrane protein [Myxococcales bacterium]|nr:BamA/TamA family outer membrane protein [Myxococcales bacterium]
MQSSLHLQLVLLVSSAGLSTAAVAQEGEIGPKLRGPSGYARIDALLPRTTNVIEAIEVRGNQRTREGVIRRRILLSEGDLLDDRSIEESRLRLLGTGYFSSVEFRLERGSERGLVILIAEVRERNTLVVDRLFLGYSEVSPVFAGGGLADTNFLGRGVTVGAEFVVGDSRQAASLRGFVPYLADTPLQLSISAILARGEELLDSDDPSGVALSYERFGGTFGIGFGVGPAQRVSLIYRLETINADRLPNLDPPFLRAAPSILFDDSLLSTMSLLYEQDTLDDPFVPTAGSSLELSVEVGTSLLGSDYEFSKYFGRGLVAFEPSAGHSLVLRAAAGLIQGRTPFFNQFFIGDFTYFAFGRDSLPRPVGLNFSEHNDYDDLLLSGGVEYAVPVHRGRSFVYRVYLYGGFEAVATASLDEIQEDPTGRGAGGFFPLSFDAGLKLDTDLGTFTFSLAYLLELAL